MTSRSAQLEMDNVEMVLLLVDEMDYRDSRIRFSLQRLAVEKLYPPLAVLRDAVRTSNWPMVGGSTSWYVRSVDLEQNLGPA